MNTLIATAAFIAVTATSAVFINPVRYKVDESRLEQVYHDWECKFIINDGYNGISESIYHYVDDYTTNVDGSISFISHDGSSVWIPYPYYYIYVNDKK